MKRTTKFRAKIKPGEIGAGLWVNDLISNDEEYLTGINPNIDPETVGEFTGHRDCEGVEIYEGDIVEWHVTYRRKAKDGSRSSKKYATPKIYIGKVQWCYCGMHLKMRDYPKTRFNCKMIHKGMTLKVIGNVHDNPDLFLSATTENE